MSLRRSRGLLLRLVRHRPSAIAAGVLLLAPAVWIQFAGGYSAWWIDGSSLVAGATGAALVWTGITGATPDWVDRT